MTAAPAPKGWCPTLLSPMQSGDGLLARVKPTGSVLPAAAARALAEAANRYGNGLIDLTGRANLQVRGLRPETVAPFAETVLALGLAHPDPEIERIRNIVASPLGAWDPSAQWDAQALARALEAMLESEPRLKSLPDKFGFLVDAGGPLPLDDHPADITIRARGGVLCVGLEESFIPTAPNPSRHARTRSGHPDLSRSLDCRDKPGNDERGYDSSIFFTDGRYTTAEAVDAARCLALAFLDLALQCPTPPRRMRDLVSAVGADAIFSAGFASTMSPSPCPSPTRGEGTRIDAVQFFPSPLVGEGQGEGEGSEPKSLAEVTNHSLPMQSPPVGWLPYPGSGTGAFGLGLPFGRMAAAMLLKLADMAEQYGDGVLCLTPWRAVLLPKVAERDAEPLRVAAETAGLIADPADPRLNIAACPGKPACASATVETRADAEILARSGVAHTLHIHVSGCAKGCAHRAPAPVTLVGDNGTYALVRHGQAWDEPALRDLTIAQAVAALRATPEGRP